MNGLLDHGDRKELSQVEEGKEGWPELPHKIQLRAFPRPGALWSCQEMGDRAQCPPCPQTTLLFQQLFGSHTCEKFEFPVGSEVRFITFIKVAIHC